MRLPRDRVSFTIGLRFWSRIPTCLDDFLSEPPKSLAGSRFASRFDERDVAGNFRRLCVLRDCVVGLTGREN